MPIMTKTTSSATTSHAMPVKANTSKSVVKKKLAYWRRAPRDGIEAIMSGVPLDCDNGAVDLVESRIKSSVHLNSINSNNGIVNVVVPVIHNY
jgi:hypothetical protein